MLEKKARGAADLHLPSLLLPHQIELASHYGEDFLSHTEFCKETIAAEFSCKESVALASFAIIQSISARIGKKVQMCTMEEERTQNSFYNLWYGSKVVFRV